MKHCFLATILYVNMHSSGSSSLYKSSAVIWPNNLPLQSRYDLHNTANIVSISSRSRPFPVEDNISLSLTQRNIRPAYSLMELTIALQLTSLVQITWNVKDIDKWKTVFITNSGHSVVLYIFSNFSQNNFKKETCCSGGFITTCPFFNHIEHLRAVFKRE